MEKEYLIGDFLKRIKRPITLDTGKEYKLVTIKINHKGVVLRGLKKGGEIKSNMYEVKEGDFILSGIDARNGAFGIIPKELDGAIVTNDFWYFEIDENIISKKLFLELTATTWFDEICKKGSDGTTQRIRLQKDKFFNQKVILPSKDEQDDLLNKLLLIKTKRKDLLNEITTQKESITQLKQSILQEAIQGKLTADWRKQKLQTAPPLLGEVAQSAGGVRENSSHASNYKWGINNLPHLKTFRKQLRKKLTPAEAKLWTLLKGKQLDGRKFRRQFSVANYILDFYCPSEKLAIEVDGQGHFEASQAEYDRERDLFLLHTGIKVLRFENKWVWDNPEGLLEEVRKNFGWSNKNPSVPQSGTAPLEGEQLWDARVLLEKIKAEKQKLIKEKKIRKEKPLPPITKEEIPFELPDGWVWCRITELFRVLSTNGKQIKNKDYLNKGDFPIVDQGKKLIGGYYNDKSKVIEIESPIIIFGDHTKEIKFIDFNFIPGADGTKLLDFYKPQYVKFLFYLLKAIKLENRGYNRHFKVLKQQIIPLPPLAEQKAIVEKVENLMQKVSAMEEEINKSEQNAEMLMQAVLKEAFEGKKEEVEV